MADTAEKLDRVPVFGIAVLRGRVEKKRVYRQQRYTKMLLPAADEFSRPDLVEVRHRAELGQVGEMVTARVSVGGFPGRPYDSVDKDTGVKERVEPVVITLTVIED